MEQENELGTASKGGEDEDDFSFEAAFSADLEDESEWKPGTGNNLLPRDNSSNPRSVRSRILSNQDTAETRSGRGKTRRGLFNNAFDASHIKLHNRKAAPQREPKDGELK